MQCKHCKYPQSHVVYTKHDDLHNYIERRRECLKCGGRFTTHERVRPINPNDHRYQAGAKR